MYIDERLLKILDTHKGETIDVNFMISIIKTIAKEHETEQLRIGGVSNCNGIKDPNIVKTYALITRKNGLTDVWCEGECLGKGLDTDGINKLNL